MFKSTSLALLVSLIAICGTESIESFISCCSPRLHGAEAFQELAGERSPIPPRISDEPPLSLELLLTEYSKSREVADELTAAIHQHYGQSISTVEITKRLNDPRSVSKLFGVSVADLRDGFATAHAIANAHGEAVNQNSFQLPNCVTLGDAPSHIDATSWKPKQIYGDLYQYAIPSGISTQEIKTRTACGEIFDRLALNLSLPAAEQFKVVYRDVGYTNFDRFVEALASTGHRIEMDVSIEVADLLHLMLRKPDGAFREIQTDVRIRTGYFTANGDEIITPAVHSHLIFRIAGPDLNTAVEFYQGMPGTHFYPSVVVKGESWVGLRHSASYRGAEALKALKAAGLYLDLLHTISREDKLFAGGWGKTGVCNDSVAVIESLLKKPVTVYPLLLDKKRILQQIETLLKRRPSLAERYRELYSAVEQVPSDVAQNPSQPQRILNSIPYKAGPTPYIGFNDARSTLGR